MTHKKNQASIQNPASHSYPQGNRQLLTERRSFLKGAFKAIGLIGAGTLFEQQALASALNFKPDDDQDKAGALFDQHSMQILKRLTDLVLPRTETPGGVELGVHQFIDHQLHAVYSEEDQFKTKKLLVRLHELSQNAYKKDFLTLSREESEKLLAKLERQENGFTDTDKENFVFTKVLMVFGYFTTEAGATMVLNYQAVPGGFVGSVPYSSVGTVWGSLDFY